MMKGFLKLSLLLFLTGLFYSCASSLFYQLATNNITPETAKPIVHSLQVQNAINITWNKDEGAEEYFLYRSTKPDNSYTKIYNGTALEYLDTTALIKTFYYYKLAKRRGNYITPISDYVMGVCEKNKMDKYEDNNTPEKAKLMDDITECNIYYYKDETNPNNIIEDRDWFYVILKSHKTMTIKFTGLVPENNLNNEYLSLNINDGSTLNVVNNNEYVIINTSDYEKKMYFQVSINTDMFLGTPSSTGGAIGSYQIEYIQEHR